MKILFIHERLGALGGAEANILLTARELKGRGHQLALLYGSKTGHAETEWPDVFAACFRLGPKHAGPCAQVVDKFQPDVIYLHKFNNLELIQTLASCGVPVVRMVHDHDLYCMRSYKYFPSSRKICTRSASGYCVFPCGGCIARKRGGFWPFRWVSYLDKKKELRLHHQFSRLVVASRFMKEELLRNGLDDEKIQICPPVPSLLRSGPSSNFSEQNLIIYAGQVIRGKGVDVLLESLALVDVPFRCLIFGEGNHLYYCVSLARKLGLADRVEFKGFVAQETLGEYYRQATVAVMSSVWPEPFGAVGLEAMSYGLPVVAFDAGGIREWLVSAYNGFLVPWMDRVAFADRVQQLLLDKALARDMGQRAQRLIKQKYDFSEYISGLESLFETVRAENREGEKVAA